MQRTGRDVFVEFFLRYQSRIYRYIVSLVPNRADADELFQQTSLTLWKIWDRYDPERDFVSWACGIAHNHVRNFLRKRKVQPLVLSDDLVETLGQLRLVQSADLEERQQALTDCLERLPSHQQQLLAQCYGSEQTIKDVAADTQRTPGSLYKALERIRLALYDCIAKSLSAGSTS